MLMLIIDAYIHDHPWPSWQHVLNYNNILYKNIIIDRQ